MAVIIFQNEKLHGLMKAISDKSNKDQEQILIIKLLLHETSRNFVTTFAFICLIYQNKWQT